METLALWAVILASAAVLIATCLAIAILVYVFRVVRHVSRAADTIHSVAEEFGHDASAALHSLGAHIPSIAPIIAAFVVPAVVHKMAKKRKKNREEGKDDE